MSLNFKIHSTELIKTDIFARNMEKVQQYYELLSRQVRREAATEAVDLANSLSLSIDNYADNLGWFDVENAIAELAKIKQIAKKINNSNADLVLIGVGGSNQAARACIEALRAERNQALTGSFSGLTKPSSQIYYAGNNLSAKSLQVTLDALRQSKKDVYINVIAKNFATLEPGSHFRIFRDFLATKYSEAEIAEHIIVTGTKGSELEALAAKQGAEFLTFPERIGGRFSAFCSVGLLPLAVFGLDCDAYIQGAKDMQARLQCEKGALAAEYAAFRNSFDLEQIKIEVLATFEPELYFLSKWWQQLFGESEGKNLKGLYPATHLYSEDLHSMGQYMQAGQRVMAETFVTLKKHKWSLPFVAAKAHLDGSAYVDNFDYLNGMDFTAINQAALEATITAHLSGAVPVAEIELEKLDMYNIGAFYYFNMVACSLSALLLGVNPFDQPGVETYKTSMFKALGK